MVNNCCVVGCANYVGKKKGLSFYRFPLGDKERCSRWEAAVRRENWQPKPHSRICSEHFESGKPSPYSSHPDYVPSVFPVEYNITEHRMEKKRSEKMSRLHRQMDRSLRQETATRAAMEEREQHEKEEAMRKIDEQKKRDSDSRKQQIAEKNRLLELEQQKRQEERERKKAEKEREREEQERVKRVERERVEKERQEKILREIEEQRQQDEEKRQQLEEINDELIELEGQI